MKAITSRVRKLTDRIPTSLGRFDADALLRAASRLYGADNIGVDAVREPIRVFAESCNTENNLTPFGQLWSRLLCHDLLSHRADISRTLRKTPAIRDVPVKSPIFVLGLPRTGTTLLHNLLACDRRSRVPKLWEAYAPVRPIPDTSWRATLSVARDRPRLMVNELLNPGLRVIHPLAPERPAECFWMLQHSFVEIHFFLIFGAWGYLDWLRGQDLLDSYTYYRQLLQILLYERNEERLVLKYPFHSNHLDTLLRVFPDARLVQLHRDPAQVVPSMASLTATLMKPNCVRRDLGRIGAATLDTLTDAAQVGARARRALPPERCFDTSYEDFIANPIGTVERMYDQFGMSGSDDFSRRMSEFISKNPKNKHGAHRYSASDYQLSPERIAGAFAGLSHPRTMSPEPGLSRSGAAP